MKITQLRNATIVLEFSARGEPVVLLVDPMLAPRGGLPRLRFLGGAGRRNPLVDLPPAAAPLLGRVTHALVTHCQRGHFDHLDGAGRHFLRARDTPVLCSPHDAAWLAARGLRAEPLHGAGRQPFFDGRATPVPCAQGTGWVGRLLALGFGWFFVMPGEQRG